MPGSWATPCSGRQLVDRYMIHPLPGVVRQEREKGLATRGRLRIGPLLVSPLKITLVVRFPDFWVPDAPLDPGHLRHLGRHVRRSGHLREDSFRRRRKKRIDRCGGTSLSKFDPKVSAKVSVHFGVLYCTEVGYLLLTQQPRVQISAFLKFFQGINYRCC